MSRLDDAKQLRDFYLIMKRKAALSAKARAEEISASSEFEVALLDYKLAHGLQIDGSLVIQDEILALEKADAEEKEKAKK